MPLCQQQQPPQFRPLRPGNASRPVKRNNKIACFTSTSYSDDTNSYNNCEWSSTTTMDPEASTTITTATTYAIGTPVKKVRLLFFLLVGLCKKIYSYKLLFFFFLFLPVLSRPRVVFWTNNVLCVGELHGSLRNTARRLCLCYYRYYYCYYC